MEKISEKEMQVLATREAQEIVVRTYKNGNSQDTRRKSTEQEKEVIATIIFGALLAIRTKEDIQVAADNAECIGNLQLKKHSINGYDTIYLPVKKLAEQLFV